MEKILTVAVPSYNAAEYLKKNIPALASLADAKALDVILVDDGSTDDTGAVADDFARRYPETVRVIHKENGGHGSGVNAGLDAALGEYYCVLDADDSIRPEGFTELLYALSSVSGRGKGAPDLVLCDFDFTDEEGNAFRHVALERLPKGKVFSFEEMAGQIHSGPDRWVWIHNAFYRTQVLRGMGFRCHEHHYYVDMEYILYPLRKVRLAAYFPLTARNYLVGRQGQSVSVESRVRHFDQYLDVVRFLTEEYREKWSGEPEQIRAYYCRRTAEYITGVYSTLFAFPDRKKARAQALAFDRELKKESPEIYRANENAAVRLLRLSHFAIFGMGAWVYGRYGGRH